MNYKSSVSALLFVAILAAAVVSICAQPGRSGPNAAAVDLKPGSFSSITRAEVEMLVADLATSNPDVLKRMAVNPELKKNQIDNLRELLSLAAEAERLGMAAEPLNRAELKNIRTEVTAVTYDREFNKDRKSLPPFSAISDARIAQFWAADTKGHEAAFQTFLNTKVSLMKAANPSINDREPGPEEVAQARDLYAKMQIYRADYDKRAVAGTLPKTFRDKVELQVKLQQAQFLARMFATSMASVAAASDQDVASYISTHPELDIASKKAKAEKILQRARSGEDFAKLADEFSDDPGNRSPEGVQQGGLYKDVPTGMMIGVFEKAALALKPGEVADRLVETEYGYHVIKLEKSLGVAPAAATYDVRHILIATTFKDPQDPAAKEVSVATYVRTKLSEEKENQLLKVIVARNKVSVPEDFTIPGTTPPKNAEATSPLPTGSKKPVNRGIKRSAKRKS